VQTALDHDNDRNLTMYFGTNNDNERIYLTDPKWDCSWYWSFGYLGNKNCHYHLSGYADGRNINMFDALRNDYQLCKPLRNDKTLWTFCELVSTAYTLKTTAETLGRGGSHYTNNPCSEIIKNEAETTRINTIVLPAVFEAIAHLFSEEYKQEQAEAKSKADNLRAAKDEARRVAKKEQDRVKQAGNDWFAANDLNTDNVIFYGHRSEWCFGWRRPLLDSWLAQFNRANKVKPFPCAYEIK
jgi:hypothetical protein